MWTLNDCCLYLLTFGGFVSLPGSTSCLVFPVSFIWEQLAVAALEQQRGCVKSNCSSFISVSRSHPVLLSKFALSEPVYVFIHK